MKRYHLSGAYILAGGIGSRLGVLGKRPKPLSLVGSDRLIGSSNTIAYESGFCNERPPTALLQYLSENATKKIMVEFGNNLDRKEKYWRIRRMFQEAFGYPKDRPMRTLSPYEIWPNDENPHFIHTGHAVASAFDHEYGDKFPENGINLIISGDNVYGRSDIVEEAAHIAIRNAKKGIPATIVSYNFNEIDLDDPLLDGYGLMLTSNDGKDGGLVTRFVEKGKNHISKKTNISLYFVQGNILYEYVKKSKEYPNFSANFMNLLIDDKKLASVNVNASDFYWRDIARPDEVYNLNMELLGMVRDGKWQQGHSFPRDMVYLPEIDSLVHKSINAKQFNGKVKGCVIDEGVRIMGDNVKVHDSYIGEGSTVTNGCDISNAFIDRYNLITNEVKITGNGDNPVILGRKTILEGPGKIIEGINLDGDTTYKLRNKTIIENVEHKRIIDFGL